MAYPPNSLVSTYGTSTDASVRPGRLAAIENAVKQAIDDIVAVLGAAPQGAFTTVQARLASLAAGTTGYSKSVRVATALGVTYTFSTSFRNGSVVDGVTLATGDRILINTSDANAGVYTVNSTGNPTRAADFAAGADFPGQQVYVREGATNAGRTFVSTNLTAPTIGTTSITFAASGHRPASYTVAASNSPLGAMGADYVCDGTADEFEINLLLFLLSLAGAPKAEINLSPGTFTFASPVVYGTTNSGDGVVIRGSGRTTTLIQRSADTIAFDMSGSGALVHASVNSLSDLRIQGSVSPHTAPAVRLYYADHVELSRIEFISMNSVGIQGLEWWDSVVSFCRFDQCGTKGSGPRAGFTGGGAGSSGGNPAILCLGDIALSGFGHTLDNCNALRFRDCVFESQTDGAIFFRGNGASEDFAGQRQSNPNTIWVDACKFESVATNGGFAPYLSFYKTNNISIPSAYVIQGNAFTGFTAQNLINFSNCNGTWIGRLHFGSVEANAATRTVVRYDAGFAHSFDTITVEVAGAAPTVSVVEYANTPSLVKRGRVMRWFGTATPFSGTPATEFDSFGTASIAIGATFVDVTHRLGRTPVDGEIMVTATAKPSSNDPGHIWISNVGATTFRINCATAPTGSALTLGWRAILNDNG